MKEKIQLILKKLGAVYLDKESAKKIKQKAGVYLPIQKNLLKPYQLQKSFSIINNGEIEYLTFKTSNEFEDFDWVFNNETYIGNYKQALEDIDKIDERYIFNLIYVVRNDEHCDCNLGATYMGIHKDSVELYKQNSSGKRAFYYFGKTDENNPFLTDLIIEGIYQYALEIYKDHDDLTTVPAEDGQDVVELETESTETSEGNEA